MKGRIERFLGGSQGGVFGNLAVDKIRRCRSSCRFHGGSCYDELVDPRYLAVDAGQWQSWSCSGQHMLDNLLPSSAMFFLDLCRWLHRR